MRARLLDAGDETIFDCLQVPTLVADGLEENEDNVVEFKADQDQALKCDSHSCSKDQAPIGERTVLNCDLHRAWKSDYALVETHGVGGEKRSARKRKKSKRLAAATAVLEVELAEWADCGLQLPGQQSEKVALLQAELAKYR